MRLPVWWHKFAVLNEISHVAAQKKTKAATERNKLSIKTKTI